MYAKAHAERHVLHLRQHYSVFVPDAPWPKIDSEGKFTRLPNDFVPHPSPFAHLWSYAPEVVARQEWRLEEDQVDYYEDDSSDEEDVLDTFQPMSPAEVVQKAISTPPVFVHDSLHNDHAINTLEIEPSERMEAPTVPPSPENDAKPPSPPSTPSRHVAAEKCSPLHHSIIFLDAEPEEEEELSPPTSQPSPLAIRTNLASPLKTLDKQLRAPLAALNTNVKEEDKKSKDDGLPPKKRRGETETPKNDENSQYCTPKKSRRLASQQMPSRRLN